MTRDIQPALHPRNRSFRVFRSVGALVLREMATTYGRSPGGYVWAVLEPVSTIALMTIIFQMFLRAPSLGDNFAYFYASAILPFGLYMQVSTQIAAAIRFSRPLLEYPSVTFLDALIARFLLATLTHLLVGCLVMTGIVYAYDLKPILQFDAIFNALMMVIILAMGVGTMNCFLSSSYPLWERVFAVLNRPLFLVSAVLFIPEDVPSHFRTLLMWNPLAHVTSEMRRGFFATYDAVHVSSLYVYCIGLGLTAVGLFLLLRYHKEILLK